MKLRFLLPALLALMLPAAAADRLFLRLDDIPGEVTQAPRQGWIAATSFGQGLQGSLKDRVESLTIQKWADISSPKLLEHLVSGNRIAAGSLEFIRGAASNSVNLLQVNLTNIVVREFAQSANKSEASEVVLLDFDVVEWVYTQIDPAGSPAGQIRSYWDEVTGTGAAFDDSDTDGDGMPNAFEALFGLNSAENDADADLDGDGASNLLEYRAGTAPNRKDSVLRVTGRRLDGRRVQVDWTPVSGRTYKLLAAPAVEGPYSELGPVDPAAGGRLVFDASRLRQFFLIKSN